MIGIYFSGTGNSKYALERFLCKYDETAKAYAVEDERITELVKENEEIIFSYPVQFSNIPKMLRDFIERNRQLWRGKKIFIIATMGLFSGDGAGVLGRSLRKYGAWITGGLHLKMPDSIADERALKRSFEKNNELVRKAEKKIDSAVENIKNGKPPREGIGLHYHFGGFVCKGVFFFH